jgi:hypothetical protein
MRHGRDHKREQEKVEGIQCPAEKTSQESVPLIAVERLEKPERFHIPDLDVDLAIGKPGFMRVFKYRD